MRYLHSLLVSVLLLTIPSRVTVASELFIVTANYGYLLDDQNEISETVGFYHVFDVLGEDGDFLKVSLNERPLKVHRGLGHYTADFEDIQAEHLDDVRRVFLLLQNANSIADENLERGLQLAHEASDAAAGVSSGDARTALRAWVLQYEAYLHVVAESYDRAETLLDEADAIMRDVENPPALQAADVVNTRGVLFDAFERYDDAIASYQKAARYLLSDVGMNHHDIAVILSNLASSHEYNGDLPQAILSRQLSLHTIRTVVPESALELAEAYDLVGDLMRDDDLHEEAVRELQKALALYQKHHTESLTEIAELHTDLIYSWTMAGDYDKAEQQSDEALNFVAGMSAEDRSYYRRDITVRLGTIDYEREDFKAALKHYEEAAAMADSDNYLEIDGSAFESIGDALVQLDDTTQATAAFEKAIDIFAITDGADSDTVLNLRNYIDDLDSFRDESLGGYVMVALPQAYMTDDEGTILDVVPGLTILEWYSSNDEFHEVRFKGELGRIPNSQLHTRRLIPGYGIGGASIVRQLTEGAAQSMVALSDNDSERAESLIDKAIASCEAEYGSENSLTLWLKVVRSGILGRTRGPNAAQEALDAVQKQIDELNPESYPLEIDARSARELILFLQQKVPEGLKELNAALDVAVERYGSEHAVVFGLNRNIGKRQFQNNDVEASERHLREALRIAQLIYPEGAAEIAESASEVAFVLSQSKQLAEAAEMLETFLGENDNLPKETHAMMVATLGKVYVGLDRTEDARKLLSTVVSVLRKSGGEKGLNVPPGLLALSQLGKLDLKEENWQDAADNLQAAITVSKVLELGDSFEAAEANRQLSEALIHLDRTEDARAALNEVLRIYDLLGGGDSPQAEQIRGQVAAMSESMRPADPVALVGPVAALDEFLILAPDDEAMYVVTTDTSARRLPEKESKIVAELSEGDDVWSLNRENDYHQIYLPDSKSFAWVTAADLQDQKTILVEKGREKLREELAKKPASALEACLAAFETAQKIANPKDGVQDPENAITTIETSLKTIESHYKFSNPLAALLYVDLIRLYQQTGQTEKLVAAADKSLTHFLSGHGYYHPQTAVVRSIRAGQHRALGVYTLEDSELSEVLKICQKRFGPNDPRTHFQELGRAANYVRMGYFGDAEEIYKRLGSDDDNVDSQPFIRASANMALGVLRASEQNFTVAATLLESAADEFQRFGNPAPALLAQTAGVLAFCVSQTGEGTEALGIVDRALQALGSPGDPAVRLSLLVLKARIAAKQQISVARQFANEAIQFGEDTFGPNNFLLSDAWLVAGMAGVLTGDADAWDQFDKARRSSHSYVQERVTFQSPSHQISFFAGDAAQLNTALAYAMMDSGREVIPRAAEWLINGHNLLSESVAKNRVHRGRIVGSREQQNLQFWQSAKVRHASIPLKLLGPNTPPAVQSAIDGMEPVEDFEKLRSQTKELVTEQQPWLSLDTVRDQLRIGEVLIVFRKTDDPALIEDPVAAQMPHELRQDVYTAWIIPAGGEGQVKAVILGPEKPIDASIDQAIEVIREIAIKLPTGSALRTAVRNERELLNRLARRIWDPVSELLPAGTTHLTICPDGRLYNVPWIALPDGDDRAIIDQYTVRCLNTPRGVMPRPTTQFRVSTPLMLSAPEPLAQDAALLQLPKPVQTALSRRTQGSRLHINKKELGAAIKAGPDLAGEIFSLLGKRRGKAPKSKTEDHDRLRDAFAQVFDDSVQSFTSEKCSEYRFFAATRPQAIHIDASPFAALRNPVEMTSEFISPESRMLLPRRNAAFFNPFMQSGIMLAGFGLEDSKHHLNDGVLTGEEIVTQDLRGTELVTLSVAPKAPSGKPSKAEAVAALPQAFRLAGAKTVVSGLWPLDAEQTTPVLLRFYQSLAENREKADALRAAQLDVRNGGNSVPVALWASFQLTGDGWSADAARQIPEEDSKPVNNASLEQELKELATKILKTYKSKDVARLLAFTADGAPSDSILEQFAPGTSRFNSLFGEGSWRWQAVSSWDGKLPNIYFTKRRKPVSAEEATAAHVEFGRSGSELFVVTLTKVEDQWTFDDIHSPDADSLQ